MSLARWVLQGTRSISLIVVRCTRTDEQYSLADNKILEPPKFLREGTHDPAHPYFRDICMKKDTGMLEKTHLASEWLNLRIIRITSGI